MATASMEQVQLTDRRLPTNWVAPKKPPYRESILEHSDIKAALLSHNTQPYLNRNEKEKFKNSFKKQICIDMLRQGFHKSFRELDSILKLQVEDRYRLGSEHPVWDRPLLDQEPTKLEYLCKKLNKAETAESHGKYKEIYSNYYDIANYFLLADDTWLSDYFFEKCLNLNFNKLVKLEPQNLAEAHCNLGLAFERRTNDYTAKSERIIESFFRAMEHFQEYYNLTNNTNYVKNNNFEDLSPADIEKLKKINKINVEEYLKNIEDNKMFTDACIHLQRIYKIIANKYAKDINEKISYLCKAYDVSKSSSIGVLEGQASYLLGNAYIENSNLETGLSYFNNYYEISKKERDLENLGKASEALANCYEKMGKVEKSIDYLKKYLQEVQDKTADRQYSRACTCLANIYNTLGKYEVAADYSKKAFDISRQMNHRDVIEYNRVLVGISKAHNNLVHFNKNIEKGTRSTINNLLRWKYEQNGEKLLSHAKSENEEEQ